MPQSGTFAQRLRRLRRLSELKARRVDALAGLTPGHTRLLERGLKKAPTVTTITALAPIFGASVEWLAIGAGTEPTKSTIQDAVRQAEANARGNG